jgi:hypothetical protein
MSALQEKGRGARISCRMIHFFLILLVVIFLKMGCISNKDLTPSLPEIDIERGGLALDTKLQPNNSTTCESMNVQIHNQRITQADLKFRVIRQVKWTRQRYPNAISAINGSLQLKIPCSCRH